jgi:peptide chain release factor 2
LASIFDTPGRLERLRQLEIEMAKSEFWQATDRAKGVMREASTHRGVIERWEKFAKDLDDIAELVSLAEEDADQEIREEIAASLRKVGQEIEAMEIEALMKGPDDQKDAILTIHPGAGGIESQDWAQMLMRMYVRWGERRGLDVEVMDVLPGEEAGIKSATIEVKGTYAYGYLKAESGVHRLVRISPFDANHRRHTSFASVFVYAEADDSLEIEMKDSDLRIDTFRASGAGGQHVHKTDSAVRITHLPTKRSQHRNRDNAMKILKARLHAFYLEEQQKKADELEKGKMDIAWGSQIRSYVLQPYTLVKDHRTGVENGNVDRILDGDLDEFIEAFLRSTGTARKG